VLILAQAVPTLPATAIAAEVLTIRPKAWPNLRVIELGDAALDRLGELIDAATTDTAFSSSPTSPSSSSRTDGLGRYRRVGAN
jgi:hypothetical protein